MFDFSSSNGSIHIGPGGVKVDSAFLNDQQPNISSDLSGSSIGSSFFGSDVQSRLAGLLEQSKATGQPQSVTETKQIPGGVQQSSFFASFSSSSSSSQ